MDWHVGSGYQHEPHGRIPLSPSYPLRRRATVQVAAGRHPPSAPESRQVQELHHGASTSRPKGQPGVGPAKLQHRRRSSASATVHGNFYDAHRLSVPAKYQPFAMARPATASYRPDHFRQPPLQSQVIREQPLGDLAMRRAERSAGRTVPRTAYPGLQAPAPDPIMVIDALPVALNRPRKLSSSSTASSSGSSGSSRESSESRSSQESRAWGSWSSKTSFESVEPGPWRPEYLYHRPAPIKRWRQKKSPGELFTALPGEVLELILDELKKLHLGPGSGSCATCWMRDLCSISLSVRKWCRFARTALYEDIQLVGNDSASQRKKTKLAYGSRLVMLRRTLRSNPHLAAMVHNLMVPPPPPGTSMDGYGDLVASVVMSCPNLERLVGLRQNYNHSFTRLFHALSTRSQLKVMDWKVEASPLQRQHKLKSVPGNSASTTLMRPMTGHVPTPDDLQPQQSEAFLDHHVNWFYLTTLSIHCLPGGTLTPATLTESTLAYLPSLQNLYLSHLPVTAFSDGSLMSLPPLKKLSLSHIAGISSAGLAAFATRSASQSLRTLSLRHANLDSLAALARILSNLYRLDTFALVQSFPPMLPDDTSVWLMPYLASASIRKLHWDITSHPMCANVADAILARSIGACGFPSLRVLRAPNDPEGIFQSLCRPQEKADTATDRFRGNGLIHLSRPTTPSSPTKLTKKSPTSPMFPPDIHGVRECSNLQEARLAAQARLEAARRLPRYLVQVIDERGMLVEKFGLGGFIGTVESPINYCLLPDAGAADERGGLVDAVDLPGDDGEDLVGREGCTGKWNMATVPADKKDRDRWWHTERPRVKAIQMGENGTSS